MGTIQNSKTYTGKELDNIFFRPMLVGNNAEAIGIRVLYNMPVPTSVHVFRSEGNILQEYDRGWSGSENNSHQQKDITMHKIKAEKSFAAVDYFNTVYESLVCNSDINLEDLTGTELEAAETELFRRAIAESLRTMMWVGQEGVGEYSLFDGLLTRAYADEEATVCDISEFEVTPENITKIFDRMWAESNPELKVLKGEGHLAFFVSSDLYEAYELWLDQHGSDAAYLDMSTGRRELYYHGIQVIDMNVTQHLPIAVREQASYIFLTDRRNLVLAVNTSDYPGSEVRMWYNADEMENRQRATFLAGCDIIDGKLITRGEN